MSTALLVDPELVSCKIFDILFRVNLNDSCVRPCLILNGSSL